MPRRRTPRVAGAALVATLAFAGAPTEAGSHSSDRASWSHRILHDFYGVVREHGRRAAGRDIIRQGVRTRRGVRPATKTEKARFQRQLRRLLRPAPRYLVRTARPPRQAPAQVSSPGVMAGGVLQRIAQCESGGNPRAVSPDGQYRGKYQFDRGTWAAVGGSGDPAAAPEAEQDRRAAALYAQRGNAPWPNC